MSNKFGKTALEVAENTVLTFEEGCPNIKAVQHCFQQFEADDFSL